MNAEQISPITTYFRVCDGVRVRFADTKSDSDTTLLLLAGLVWLKRNELDSSLLGGTVAALILGFLLPKMVLQRMVKRYRRRLQEALPDRGLSVLSILRSRQQVFARLKPFRHLAANSRLN